MNLHHLTDRDIATQAVQKRLAAALLADRRDGVDSLDGEHFISLNLSAAASEIGSALVGPPPKQPAHSHLADIDLLNRLRAHLDTQEDHPFPSREEQLLLDIWEAVKPGDIGEAISEVGILSFAQEQWGERTFEKIALKTCGEAGEFAEAISKIEEGRSTIEKADMEAGDVLVVLSQYAAMRGTSLDALRAKAFRKCQAHVIMATGDANALEVSATDRRFLIGPFDQVTSRLHRNGETPGERIARLEKPMGEDPMPKATTAAEELRQELRQELAQPTHCPKCRCFWTDCVCVHKFNPNHG